MTKRILAAAAILVASTHSFAQGFAALISPPRFELKAEPGKRTREVIEITNASAQAAKFKLRTAEWTLGPDGAVKFEDA
jgi:hypothetical protein